MSVPPLFFDSSLLYPPGLTHVQMAQLLKSAAILARHVGHVGFPPLLPLLLILHHHPLSLLHAS